ncbi:methyltransferase domain-containing protein [Candidatus Daviesbacteria bacterium]|nr:methyltransferase domain-containing protein [Candidatus Daviesbacteria bacterium]
MTLRQTIANKKAEVQFREKLVKQHKGEQSYFPGQPDNLRILIELKKRLSDTKKDILNLKKEGLLKSPYLEIGAEKCQRSMLCENQFKIKGIAADISFHSLDSANFFAKKLGFKKMPLRICLDAYNLPFLDNCIPFIFFYQTLHHFPDPSPILRESARVLRSDGVVFINEEPIKQLFNLNLFRRDFNLNNLQKLLKRLLILPFISTIGKSEMESGIIETSFWLDKWESILKDFERVKVTATPLFGKGQLLEKNAHQGWLNPNLLTKALIAILGGGIKVIATKNKKPRLDFLSNDIFDILACPDCKVRVSLKKSGSNLFYCQKCGSEFPIKKDILIFLPRRQRPLLKKIYVS